MQLTVVILNYNVRYFLEQCLMSVSKAIEGIDAEIIVVDNASSDDSCEMVQKKFPHVKLIKSTENAGFPKGNNIGVAAAKGDFICILNPDTVVSEDTFSKAIEFHEGQENPGIVGVKLIDGRGKFLPESKRGTPTPWVAFTKVSGLHKLSANFFGKYYASHLSEKESGEVDILVGAFMLMKRKLYLEVGGFDEGCFMYSDDIDLSYTVKKTGKKNFYFSGTSVIHYKGESTVRDAAYMTRFQQAMDFFYKKHFRRSVLFDFSMKVGAYFFSVFKKNQADERPKVFSYALISQDDDLAVQLKSVLRNPIQFFPYDVKSLPATFQVLFDAEQFSFNDIITKMESLEINSPTFRIVHKSKGFLIGSDSPNDRGEVVNFTTRR